MRRLKQIKLTYREKTGTSYKIVWEESSGGKLWEKHLLESSEYPRAELEEAVDDMGRFLIAACAIRLTDEQMRRSRHHSRGRRLQERPPDCHLSRYTLADGLRHCLQWPGDAVPATGR